MNVAERLHWRTLMHECRVNVSVACLAVAKSLFGRASTLRFDRNYDRYDGYRKRVYLNETIVYGGVLWRGERYSCVPLNTRHFQIFTSHLRNQCLAVRISVSLILA